MGIGTDLVSTYPHTFPNKVCWPLLTNLGDLWRSLKLLESWDQTLTLRGIWAGFICTYQPRKRNNATKVRWKSELHYIYLLGVLETLVHNQQLICNFPSPVFWLQMSYSISSSIYWAVFAPRELCLLQIVEYMSSCSRKLNFWRLWDIKTGWKSSFKESQLQWSVHICAAAEHVRKNYSTCRKDTG